MGIVPANSHTLTANILTRGSIVNHSIMGSFTSRRVSDTRQATREKFLKDNLLSNERLPDESSRPNTLTVRRESLNAPARILTSPQDRIRNARPMRVTHTRTRMPIPGTWTPQEEQEIRDLLSYVGNRLPLVTQF